MVATVRVGVAALMLTGLLTGATASPAGAEGRRVDLVVSNGHYCRQDPCQLFSDAGYSRTPDGPVAGTDNERMMVDVSPGDTVVWTYRDTGFCDPFADVPFADCKGHEVRFEDGTPSGGDRVGFMPSRSGPVTVTWQVPADARPGSLLRYFCTLESETVKGISYPAGTSVLTAHYLYGTTGILKVV
jgi:hypothetical protein